MDDADFPEDGDLDASLARAFQEQSDIDEALPAHEADRRPAPLRSLHWLRKNVSTLRVIVSLQRVTPPSSSAADKFREIS